MSRGQQALFVIIGAQHGVTTKREAHDYYATHPTAVPPLVDNVEFCSTILEPACGEGHISKALARLLPEANIISSDLIDRGYGDEVDFFEYKEFDGDIVTNPPYSIAEKFIYHGLSIVPKGRHVCMLLRILFLEGQRRRKLFMSHPPKKILVFSKRIMCAKGANFGNMSSAVGYAWFVWEKGYEGDTIIDWVMPKDVLT